MVKTAATCNLPINPWYIMLPSGEAHQVFVCHDVAGYFISTLMGCVFFQSLIIDEGNYN
jgi:hypothetical protein